MIYFGVTLRSRASARDWNHVVEDFNRTLRSICRQTDPDFRVIVACHEIPPLREACDSRVEFLTTDVPTPVTHGEMMQDKGWKLSIIGRRIREYGGGYTMIVDADDLVSNRIAAYVKAHPDENGFGARYGYVYSLGDAWVKRMYAMDRVCGSCTIARYAPEELPEELPESPRDDSTRETLLIRRPHSSLQRELAALGRPVAEIPFPTTVYVRNTGDNHSMFGGGDLGWKRKAELMLRRRIPVEKIAGEFGLE